MGGIGSGSYYRGSSKTTFEEMQRLDIPSLKKAGYLSEGNRFGTWNWNCGGEPSGSITLHSNGWQLTVSYKRKPWYEDEWEDVQQTIQLVTTPCHFGGERKWFKCPYCKKRVGVLALGNDMFACRKCYKVPYGSQSESRQDRITRAQRKLADRIFEDEDLQIKKKGMHQKTFDRLFDKYCTLDEAWSRNMLAYFQRKG